MSTLCLCLALLFFASIPVAEASRFGGGNGGKRAGNSGPSAGQNLHDETQDYSEVDQAGEPTGSGTSTYGESKRKLRSGEQSDD